MKYIGHSVFLGDPDANGKATVVVYAEPDPNGPWVNMDPAKLKDAPRNFNAAKEGEPPEFKRPHWMVNPNQLRFKEQELDGRKVLVLLAMPIPGLDGLTCRRRLNNLVLSLAIQCGYMQYLVSCRHGVEFPFTGTVPRTDKLPDPVNMPRIQAATEMDLHNLGK